MHASRRAVTAAGVGHGRMPGVCDVRQDGLRGTPAAAPREPAPARPVGSPFVELDRAAWSRLRESTPLTLTEDDLTDMLGSRDLFARKFDTDVDARVLERLAERVAA